MNKGILYSVTVYVLWGFFPIYWKLLHHVPALQLLGHRIAWSFLLLLGVIFITKGWNEFRAALNARTFRIYLIAALLIGVNWLTYVWAVNAGFIVETSLGYFINPLLSVLMGVLFLRERLRHMQWIPVALAAMGVAYLTFAYGQLPWIALLLAFTFGFYGLVKKIAPLGSVYGLTFETGILFLPALAYLGVVEADNTAAFLHSGITSDLLMIGAGLVTTIPLLMFASAAKQIPLTMIGVLQYIAPTIQFVIGVFIYKETFDQSRLVGFSIVWLALIIFWVENYLANRIPLQPIPEMGEG
ncbi:MAG: EamA family transporter RarD [Anaerolineae bacterium]|nr:EamA family transporter RarD [Anaerolineae bacterium]MCI0607665.1 EamA family transporter RarD [Anaerolineae bacterium]